MGVIRIATRGSKLALAQAEIIQRELERLGASTEIHIVKTHGDRDQKSSLVSIGGNGLFVKEVEYELVDGNADIAVHSGKDLPYDLLDGLTIAGTPAAADPRDVIVRVKGQDGDIKVIGTGSPRRVSQCEELFGEASCESIRGNVDTRLRKLREGQYDAIVLAKAGLDRLGADLSEYEVSILPYDEFIPSACQGIIAVECRANDSDTLELLGRMSDEAAFRRFTVERHMMKLLEADCTLPVAVHAKLEAEDLTIYAMFNGRKTSVSGNFGEYRSLCEQVKDQIYKG